MRRNHEEMLSICRSRLFGYAVALTRDPARAEDLMQDCVLRASAAGALPDDPRAFRAWMFRVMRNLWIDRQRARRRRHEFEADAALSAPAPASGGEDAVVNRLAVRQAFLELPKAHRDVLALVDIGGFTYEETAALIGAPIGTVMSRVSRGRAALLAALAGPNVVALPARRNRS